MSTLEYIKSNEGLRLKPYKCSAGKTSIGYGRNIEDNGVSEDEAEYMLHNDITRCVDDLYSIFPYFQALEFDQQTALTDMMFNLGKTRFLKFKKMIQAVKDNDFGEAAKQILDSRYAKQLPKRAKRNAELIRGEDD